MGVFSQSTTLQAEIFLNSEDQYKIWTNTFPIFFLGSGKSGSQGDTNDQ